MKMKGKIVKTGNEGSPFSAVDIAKGNWEVEELFFGQYDDLVFYSGEVPGGGTLFIEVKEVSELDFGIKCQTDQLEDVDRIVNDWIEYQNEEGYHARSVSGGYGYQDWGNIRDVQIEVADKFREVMEYGLWQSLNDAGYEVAYPDRLQVGNILEVRRSVEEPKEEFSLYRSCWYATKQDVQDAQTFAGTITEAIHNSCEGWSPQEVTVIEAFLNDVARACAWKKEMLLERNDSFDLDYLAKTLANGTPGNLTNLQRNLIEAALNLCMENESFLEALAEDEDPCFNTIRSKNFAYWWLENTISQITTGQIGGDHE